MKLIRKLLKLIAILITLGVLCYVALILFVAYKEANVPEPVNTPDAIIVLGAQVMPDGEVSIQLGLRLEAALGAYQKYNSIIVTCGAMAGKEPRPEADVMRDWLVARGVPENKILTDSTSFNTKQNIRNAITLLDHQSININTICVITSDYHLPRALAIANDELEGENIVIEGIGSPCMQEYWLPNHAREALAWVKYWMQKYIGFPKD